MNALAEALPDPGCSPTEDWPAVLEVDAQRLWRHVREPRSSTSERDLQEPGRSLGAFDGATLVGLTSAFSFDLTVPGAVVPAAGSAGSGFCPRTVGAACYAT
jgi:hypothetical protein